MTPKMAGFEPLNAPRLRDQVYLALRQQISSGHFPEDGVIEQDLSEALQVSRTPVREALFQLCREGVLVKRGRRSPPRRARRSARCAKCWTIRSSASA